MKLLAILGVFLLVMSSGSITIASGAGQGNGKGNDKGGGGGSDEDPGLAILNRVNEELSARGLSVLVGEIEYFTIGAGRPPTRILQQPFRWVPDDFRRLAAGDDITYLVDSSDGATTSGLASAATESAIDSAMTTWNTEVSCSMLNIVKRPDPGVDPDIFDSFFGFGTFGFPFFADITHAGWLPKAFFDALLLDGGDFIIAISVTFIFPTDINNDQYIDTALVEIYYNDNFGGPLGIRLGNPWAIDAALPAIDVETVALHESGHGLGVGHFGPPPKAVMNPGYTGIHQTLRPIDKAGQCTLYSQWPNQ